MSDEVLAAGTRVAIWVGLRLLYPYPDTGVVKQYLPDYPGGPAYEVTFEEGPVPSACLLPHWLFPLSEAARPKP